jgi:hypothetical protein
LVAGVSFAQSGPSGGLSGTVIDPAGAAVPNAQIVLKNQNTGLTREIKTNNQGYWEARVLPTGPYEVTIESNGFQKLVHSGVNVEAAVVASGRPNL